MGNRYDLIIAPLYLFFVFVLAIYSRNKFKRTHPKIVKYFYPAFTIKMICVVLIIWFFDFVMAGLDMVGYYRAIGAFWDAMWSNPTVFHEMLTEHAKDYSAEAVGYFKNRNVIYYAHAEKVMKLCRIMVFFAIPTFKSIYAMGFIIGYFSFMASWRTFIVFYENYPKAKKYLAYSCLFLPSLLFWGSAPLLRDTMVMIGLGYGLYFAHKFINYRTKRVRYFLYFGLCVYWMLLMKPYVAFAFVPSVFMWWFLLKSYRFKRNNIYTIKRLSYLLLGLIGAMLVAYFVTKDSNFRFQNLFRYLRQTQYYHSILGSQTGGHGYSFNYEHSIIGVLSTVPSAIAVSLFRPYLWEVRAIQILPNSIEGFFFLLTTIYVLLKVGIFKSITRIIKSPTLLFMMGYALSYLFLVGFATYNFGSLVRYKIPGLQFYFSVLAILYSYHLVAKNNKRQSFNIPK